MNIVNRVNDSTVDKACQLVMQHYKDKKFLDIVKTSGPYNYTEDESATVAQKIKNADFFCYVIPWKSFLPWSVL